MQDRVRQKLDHLRQAVDQLATALIKSTDDAALPDAALLAPLLELPTAASPQEVVELIAAAAVQALPNTAGACCLQTDDADLDLAGLWASGRTWLAQRPEEHADLVELVAARSLSEAVRLPMQLQGVQHGELRIWGLPEHLLSTARLLAANAGLALGGQAIQRRLDQRLPRDPLTGLVNERYLVDTLQREIYRAHRQQSQISVILLELDTFSAYKHHFGSTQADRLLLTLAGVLQASFRGSDSCGRIQEHRFAVLLPDASLSDAQRRAKELLDRISTLRIAGHETPPQITACAGIAAYPAHAETPSGLLDGAEAALHLAKQVKPGSVCVAQREEQT